jgi:hypothetical protein
MHVFFSLKFLLILHDVLLKALGVSWISLRMTAKILVYLADLRIESGGQALAVVWIGLLTAKSTDYGRKVTGRRANQTAGYFLLNFASSIVLRITIPFLTVRLS